LTRDQAVDVLRQSVRLAIEARDDFERVIRPFTGLGSPKLVAASIGCYGAYLHDGSEYRGNYGLSVQQLIDWHRPRVEILAASGADLLACETVPSLVEAKALINLLAEFPDVAAWLSFSCKDEQHLCHGETFAEAVQLANEAPTVVAVGVNCTAPHLIDGLLASVAGIARKPLVVYPNSGEAWDAANHCWVGMSAAGDWAACARRWHGAGARLIGGCCRTTPETIHTIAQALRG
jgi:homocysteine S-methyltransferase